MIQKGRDTTIHIWQSWLTPDAHLHKYEQHYVNICTIRCHSSVNTQKESTDPHTYRMKQDKCNQHQTNVHTHPRDCTHIHTRYHNAFTHKHAHTHTHTRSDGQTRIHRHTHMNTHTHTHRYTHIQIHTHTHIHKQART